MSLRTIRAGGSRRPACIRPENPAGGLSDAAPQGGAGQLQGCEIAKLRRSGPKPLESLSRTSLCGSPFPSPDSVSPTVAGRADRPSLGGAQKQRGPRRSMAATGPCFAARETSVMLQMICRRRVRLAFAARRHGCWSSCFGTPFRCGISSGDGVSTLIAQGHSSWSGGVMATPSFCRASGRAAAGVAFAFACS